MSEHTSYLTADEVQAAQTLHKRAPYALCNVSMGYFSLSRKYGGCTFQGCHYTYMHGHDECVRDDVLRMVTKMRKKKPAVESPQQQESLLVILVVLPFIVGQELVPFVLKIKESQNSLLVALVRRKR